MAPPLLTLQNIALTLGERTLLDGAEMSIGQGDRICLVGRNGSGKSTLLRIAAGEREADSGARFLQPGRRVAYLPQEPDIKVYDTITHYVSGGLPEGAEQEQHRVAAVLDALGIEGHAATATLSGGEARRAAIARALVSQPDILLLDEPTNHLDLPAIQWLERELEGFRGGLVIISHDRAFLNHLTRTTLWLDRGMVRRLDKGFAEFESWSEEVLAKEEQERRKLDKLIAQETVWSHQGITARRKRNQGRLRRLYDMRKERAGQVAVTGQAKMAADSGSGSGRLVMEAEHISKAFGGRVIVRDFSTRILRGDRVGIVGPNGAGKTTLLRMLTGDLKPDGGSVRLGTNLSPAYLDQQRARLDPQATVWDTLCDTGGDQIMVQERPRHVVGYLRDFLFEEAQARSPVASLSGGERNRLLLAKVLAKPSNFLILDEPTNDLDMDTLDLLQEMLADFDGTVLLVSHDRDFLDRVVTSTIAMEGNGEAVEYVGGFSDYMRQRGDVAGPSGAPREKARPQTGRPARGGRTSLSYKQQRALDNLPGRMDELQQQVATLQAQLEDAGFFKRDPQGFAAATDRLGATETELAACEEEWLELEMLREELAGGK